MGAASAVAESDAGNVTAEPESELPAEAVPANAQNREKEHTFDVTMEKGDKSLGLDISAHDKVTLLIMSIKDGVVADWNSCKERTLADTILPGDRVIEINGE